MQTFSTPNHCPKCQSKNIYIMGPDYQLDAWGDETDIIISGIWTCKDCGDVFGRKTSRYQNDVDSDSLL